MSLYQKYRPQEFDSLSGQEHIKKILKNALKKSLVAHAYLFCGPRGTGKTTTARLIAKSLNCSNFDLKTGDPCNECDICKAITDSSLIDVIEIDAASNRGIDEIRELKETIRFAPTLAKNKVYIIDEVHMLTNEAFNALLKTLEEPPENVFFILATTEVHKIPETIMSRCQRFDFRRISKLDLINRLKFIAEQEKFKFEVEALEMIAIYADGGLRDAISILDQLSVSGDVSLIDTKNHLGTTGIDTLYDFLNSLETGNDKNAITIINSLHEQGSDIKQFETDILKIAREKLHLAIEKGDNSGKQQMLELIKTWQEIHNEFKNSFIPELPLEVLVVKYCNRNNFRYEATSVGMVVEAGLKQIPAEVKNEIAKPVPIVEKQNVAVSKPEVKKVAEVKIAKAVKPEAVEADNSTNSEETTPLEVAKEVVAEKPAVIPDSNLDVEREWKKILEKINIPSLRLTLKNAHFKVVAKETAEIKVSSNFAYDNIKKSENINAIETLINEFTGLNFKVNLVKDIIELKSIVKENPAPVLKSETNGNQYQNDPQEYPLDAEPFDMFDGEFIE